MKEGYGFNIGLIGVGSFGEFMLPYLKKYGFVHAYDKTTKYEIWYTASIKGAASCDLIIYSVPAQNLEEVLIKTKDYIKKDAFAIDVCSVKAKPCKLMKKYLPKGTEIIGTHPLFGPESAKNGLEGHSLVLCPVRTNRLEKIACFIEDNLKLKVIVTSPEEHDRQMAYVQGISHLLARALNKIDSPCKTQRTAAYDILLKFREMLGNDSDALYETIQKENPYAKNARDEFLRELTEEIKKIDG